MQGGKSYAAAAARKPNAQAGAKSNNNSNGNGSASGKPAPASNKKKSAGESKGKPSGKDTPPAAPPGFATPKQPTIGFSDQQQRVLRHRALFAFRFFVGKAVEVQLDDKSLYAGILDCIDPDDFSIVLKNTHRMSEAGEPFESGSTVIFKRRQIVHLSADGSVNYSEGTVGAAAAAAGGFRTDTEISGRQHDHLFGRELQAASSWLDPQLDSGELEDSKRRSSKSGWNQFEANEKLFGVVSSFDENIYTTKLDKTKISNQQSRDAERIAFEIERQTSSNFHLQEERGQSSAQQGDDLDEEARYSSVDRKHNAHSKVAQSAPGKSPNSYVPPAMRNNSQRQTSGGGKAQAKQTEPSQPKQQSSAPASSTTSAAPAPVPASSTAAAPASTTAAPKPLSFSDAVTGRTAASAKPEQKKATAAPATAATSSPKKVVPSGSANGTEAKAESKPAATPAALAATTTSSPEKKSSGAGSSSKSKEPSTKAPKEAKAKTDDASSSKKTAKNTSAAAPAAAATSTPAAAPAKKLTLNPNAKEFKFNVGAAEFTPKITVPAPAPVVAAVPAGAMSSPYRGPASHHHHQQHHHQQHHHQQHHHQQQHMGGHMHHQPHPGMVYSPMPEEWMYEGAMGMDEAEMMQQGGYMAYGVPMVPGPGGAPMMQPQVYSPQMMPQQNMRMMAQRPHGNVGSYGGGGYQQPPYNPRAYYPPSGGVPGGMPYPGAAPVGVVTPQPPLPRHKSMMLPPIRKSSNAPLSAAGAYNPPAENAGNTVANTAGFGGKRHGDASSEKTLRDEPQYSAGAPSGSSNFVMDRIHSLERENELIRAELSHFRQHLSNNQQQREDERLSLTKVSDELQRLVHAFNSKLQADSVFQQREQQKCALLFAEIARLGHSVEGVELTMKTVGDDTRRRLEVHEQQLQYASTASKQQQSSQVSAQRSEETQQIEELQHAMTLVKNAHAQFRSEVEAERNERWRTDNERNQWMGDLRAAVAKIDASMDTKIIHQVERLNNKRTTDKMDMMRLLEEYREFMTGADFKRISSQMLEFSRINDHLLALERWIHSEFGHIKRMFQFVISDTDGKLQALALEVMTGVKSWQTVLLHQDDEHRMRLQDIHDAVGEVAHAMQKKFFALEEVLPMEVKARQQNDDKLRRRVEGVVKLLTKALEATREECIVPQAQLKARMKIVEDVQRQIVDQVDEKQEVVNQTIQEFIKDSDAMLAKLADYVEKERQNMLASVVSIGDATEGESIALSETITTAADVSPRPPLNDVLSAVRLEWTAFFETQLPLHLSELKSSLIDEVEQKITSISEQTTMQELQELHGQLQQDRIAVQGLQTWTVSHAQECRQCYDYLNWAFEDVDDEETVYRCLNAAIDQVADMAALEEFQLLEDNTSWAVAQITEIQEKQQPTNSSSNNGFEQPQQIETATNDEFLDGNCQDAVDSGPDSDLGAATVDGNTGDECDDGDTTASEAEAPTQPANGDTAEADPELDVAQADAEAEPEEGAAGEIVWL